MNANNNKHAPILRIALLCCIIVLFLFIGIVFIYQYGQYRTLESRLMEAYASQQYGSDNLNQLFTTYSEAENAFRLYTLDFNEPSYQAYVEKLNVLQTIVFSLDSLSLSGHLPSHSAITIQDQQKIALEFALLKKKMEHLVLHTTDSLHVLTASSSHGTNLTNASNINAKLQALLADTTTRVKADTIVKRKESLFKRIFNAKDDTMVIAKERETIDRARITTIQEELASLQNNQNKSYLNNNNQLRNTFLQLRVKERELIATNLDLLNSLKESAEMIKMLNNYAIRQAEKEDFSQYRDNVSVFGKQLIFALILMLVMIAALVYYQAYATSYERRLRVEKDYAARLAEEKTSVLANISHEIRTPLNSLLGIVDLLKNRAKLGETDEKLVNSAYYSINVISNNVTDILNLSKLEASNKGEIAMAYFCPHQSFNDLVTLHQNQAELKNLQLHTDIIVNPQLTILSNEFRIKQIVSNFLSNAIKYTQKGVIIFRASITETNENAVLYVEVEDSGIGVREQDRRQVFRKYFTASPNTGGIGLGLYISKIMAEELGGSIGVRGKTGNGSIFFATIPFQNSKLDAQGPHKASLVDLPVGLRLLVVDDNPVNILFMKQFFKDMESAFTVNNAEDALAFLHETPVDVVITDINMPGTNGIQLLEKIRAIEAFSNIKVLAISADIDTLTYADNNHRRTSFDGFIEKPFTEHEIVSTIVHAIRS